ncbi:MAG: GNAT family N-acetyltransferase [Pseudomonadota bacterium]
MLDHPQTQALLDIHLDNARSLSPACSMHALDHSGLQQPQIDFFTAWQGETLVGFGAIKDLGDGHGEIKSMHVAAGQRGQGLADDILTHLLDHARSLGMVRVSLETGSQDGFGPARKLYAKHGFDECQPFADYIDDPNSFYMTRRL